MGLDHMDSSWRQHFPTYRLKNKEIALEEYRSAAKLVESEERIFLNASNLAFVVAAALGSVAVGSIETLSVGLRATIPPLATKGLLLFLTALFSYISIRYFADRQKKIVYSTRKVIILRRMLGLSFGPIRLVLPNWRIEGADEPFAIRLFPGWNTYVCFPLALLAGISSAVIYFLVATMGHNNFLEIYILGFSSWQYSLGISVLWAGYLAYAYRKALLDTNEMPRLLLTLNLASIVNLGVATNIEYVIYRSVLARFELQRMKVKLSSLKNVLVFIEDRRFYQHRGISFLSIIRAALGMLRIKRRSGGSTITQQLVRTLFVTELHKKWRRKFIELLMATWFDRITSKEEQLETYLASVRFASGIYGVVSAMQHYWGDVKSNPTHAEAFFLVERVSNISSGLLVGKIVATAVAALQHGVLKPNDLEQLIYLYQEAVSSKTITASQEKLSSLSKSLRRYN